MNIRNYKLTNACVTTAVSLFPAFTDNDFGAYLSQLPYLQGTNYYFVFQREQSAEGTEHWQLYLELNKQQYFTVLRRDLRNSRINPREKTQEQAISYCKKEKTRVSGPYEKGSPKKISRTKTTQQKEGRNNGGDSRHQKLARIIDKIKQKEFGSFAEIVQAEPVFFLENQSFLKNVWNNYHPVTKVSVKACKVIWCFGKARAGKSVWTKKYLQENNWTEAEIVQIFPNNMAYNDRIIFEIPDENRKVLIINEVDHEFPKHNNLIAFIDRNAGLVTKDSKIENNFELIIINSVFRPEEVFSYLGQRVAEQVLGRIFNPYLGCKVYEIEQNEEQLAAVISHNLVFTDHQFQNWYQPILKQLTEPNYALIK